MKKPAAFPSLLLLLLVIGICSVIANVFLAGMKFAISLMILVIILIAFVAMRSRKKNNDV